MKKSLFLLLIICLITSANAAIDIKGHILNEKEQPIFDFIEISLNSQTQVTGDSKYLFKDVNEGDYTIKINSPESKNHNPLYSSYENKFTIVNENGRLTFYNYSPQVILTKGQTFNFKYLLKEKSGQINTQIDLKLYNMQNNKYVESFSNIPTRNYRIVINDPFSPNYNQEFDFSEPDNKRNQIELTIGTYNENIVVYSYIVWKNGNIKYTTANKNIGSVIPLNFPGSPLVYTLEPEAIAPWVVKSWPINNQTMFSIRDKIKLYFSENITFNQSVKNKILLYNTEDKEYIDLSITYDMSNKTVILTPKDLLKKTSEYTLIISNIGDTNNNIMENDYRIKFYTETNDFEDFNHKYLVKNLKNIELKDYVPEVKGGNTSLITTSISFEESQKLGIRGTGEIVVRQPELTVNIPQENTYYSTGFTINYKVKDIDNFSVKFLLNGKEIPLSYKISEQGQNRLTAYLYDGSGKELKKIDRTFVIDSVNPVIEITPQLSSTTYLTSFNGKINITDDFLDSYSIKLNGKDRKKEINLTESGKYTLEISALDKSNNTSKKNYDIIIDNNKPFIVTDLDKQKYYKIPLNEKIQILDSNIQSSEIYLNGELLSSNVIKIEKEGRYRLKAKAVDKCNNTTEIEKVFEVFTENNYAERSRLEDYLIHFTELFQEFDKIEKESGIFYLERIIYGLISNDVKATVGIKEFNKIKALFTKITIPELDKIKNSQVKSNLLLEKYWVYPKVAQYINDKSKIIEKNLKDYPYLTNKFRTINQIIQISQGKILSIYKNQEKVNLDYFNMNIEDLQENLENMIALGVTNPVLKLQIETLLNNIYFGKKIINMHPSSEVSALSDAELIATAKESFIELIKGGRTKNLSYIINKTKNTESKKALEKIQANLRKHSSIKILKPYEWKVSKNFFGINAIFVIANKRFDIDFWFEKDVKTNQFFIDHISNLNYFKSELAKIKPIMARRPEENEKKSSNFGIILIIIILIVLISGTIFTVLFYFSKKRKKSFDIPSDEIIPDTETENITEIDSETENKKGKPNKFKEIINNISNKIVPLFNKITDKIKQNKKTADLLDKLKSSKYISKFNDIKKSKIKKDKVELTLKDIYPEDLNKFRTDNIEEFKQLFEILTKSPEEFISASTKTEKKEEIKIVENDDILPLETPSIQSDETLESIAEELDTVIDEDKDDKDEETLNLDDVINDLKETTPEELIQAEKQELENENLAEELGVNDYLDENLDEYLNLEIVSDEDEENDKKSIIPDIEDKNIEEISPTEDDSEDLLALDDLFKTDDDK